MFHCLTSSLETSRSTGPLLGSSNSWGDWSFHVRLHIKNHFMIVDMLLAICPLNKTFLIAPLSSSHQIKKMLGQQRPLLQVSTTYLFFSYRVISLRHCQVILRLETFSCSSLILSTS